MRGPGTGVGESGRSGPEDPPVQGETGVRLSFLLRHLPTHLFAYNRRKTAGEDALGEWWTLTGTIERSPRTSGVG